MIKTDTNDLKTLRRRNNSNWHWFWTYPILEKSVAFGRRNGRGKKKEKEDSISQKNSENEGNTNWWGRLSTVDLLIKVACFEKVSNVCIIKTADLK